MYLTEHCYGGKINQREVGGVSGARVGERKGLSA